MDEEKKVYTVQETSKPLKAFSAISIIVIFFAIFFIDMETNGLLKGSIIVLGCLGYAISKILIWWKHG